MTATDALELTKDALRRVGLDESLAVLIPENLVGDDDPRCVGYVQLDGGTDIFPQLVGSDVGWGVSYVVCVPGKHTMPNGDPGYPDTYDAVDLLPAVVEATGIGGTRHYARPASGAIAVAIEHMVRERLGDWGQEA